MALSIETFSNVSGGHSLFKALGHPLAAPRARDLLAELRRARRVAVYDPRGYAESFAVLHDVASLPLGDVLVQDRAHVGAERLGRRARPVTELGACDADVLLVADFDAERSLGQIDALLAPGTEVRTFDRLRLPADMLTRPARYLDPLNFATNFAFFRDADGQHTRLVTANYWSGYGAPATALWCCLLDADGATLAAWREALPPGPSLVTIDSRAVRERFALGPFTGSLFLHAVGAAGHDVVKYALDVYGDAPGGLSCTHDANAWPADLYAGLPAPGPGERVLLWVQNSHPCPIPGGAVGLNVMGSERVAWLGAAIPPFGTRAVDVASLLPEARWPQQLEVRAGKHFVRPRYEVLSAPGRRRIAHANVERVDLEPDPELPELTPLFGKGYLLPAPVLPPGRWASEVLPTPMATTQRELPVQLVLYDRRGGEVGRHRFGRLGRGHAAALGADALLPAGGGLDYGHMELLYDFAAGGEGDGWLHALFRYRDRRTGHAAETSFGAHIFNTVLVHRDEPQSYTGHPPGLSTRLFLRLGEAPLRTLCHLIYPASTPWRETSDTALVLHDAAGAEVARERLRIPCGGSALWYHDEVFGAPARRRAGDRAYVLVRDPTCRLFGYHGLDHDGAAFSLDHMFGF